MQKLYQLMSLFVILLAQARPAELPKLEIEGPPELAAVRDRLQAIHPGSFADIMQLLGITDAGPAIRVILAPENSDLARGTPQWISGFAVAESASVVIFPARSPGYPHDTLEDVLRHEVAHVLIWRASGGGPIPRWFNEGLAMAAERERGFEDQTQLLYQLVSGSRTTLNELDRLFVGGRNNQIRAYALAGAIVHDLSRGYGSLACAEILARMDRGDRFDDAFKGATGLTPDNMAAEFWHRQRIWTSWVPIVASSTTLWLVVTLLAILAILIRRRKNRAIEEKWAEEGEDDIEP